MTDAPEFFDTDALADWLEISPATIRKWRHEGTGPKALKLGRRVRYRRSDVEAWLAESYSDGAA